MVKSSKRTNAAPTTVVASTLKSRALLILYLMSLSERVKAMENTYKTMRALHRMYPEHEFFFILGADSLFSIEQWKNFRKIFPTCTILAAMRDDKDAESMKEQIKYLCDKYGADIKLLQAPLVEISSTTIRERAAKGLSIRFMVPEAVSNYIDTNHLYRQSVQNKMHERSLHS